MITILGVIAVSFLGVSAYVHQSWSICLYAGYYFLIAICKIMTEDYLQQRIEGEGRSTIHSIVSLALNLFGFLLYGILGVLFGCLGLFGGIVILSLVMLLIILSYSKVCKRLIKEQL